MSEKYPSSAPSAPLREESAWPAFHSEVLPEINRQEEHEAAAEAHIIDAAHQLAAASEMEGAAAASDALPASLLELRTPSQLCCWANGCYPLPPVISLSQHQNQNYPRMRIAIQLPGNARKRLQQVAGVDCGAVQLRTIAVQQTAVLLDEEADQSLDGRAVWINLPTADLRIGVVYLYLLAKADGVPAAPRQLNLFASLPMLALPLATGSELEDLFGTMIQEMSSREEEGESSGTCDSEGGSEGDSDGGSSAGSGTKGQLQRCLSAPVVSIRRSQRAPSESEFCRWRDQMKGLSVRSEQVRRGSAFSNIRTSAGGMEGSPVEVSFLAAARTADGGSSITGTMYSPASLFSPLSYSQLPSPSSSQAPPPSPLRRFSLATKHGPVDMSGSNVSALGPLSDLHKRDQQTNFSTGHPLQSPPSSAGIGSHTGTAEQAAQNLPPSLALQYQQPGQQQGQKQLVPAAPQVSGNQADSALNFASCSPNLAVGSLLPGGMPNLQAILPDDVAETLSSHLVGLASLNILPGSCTVFRSAASACNLALSLLSNRSPSVRSIAKSMHDGYSSYAGLIAASKRMHIYASSAPLVAATFSTHFGPLSADLGYVLETAERCVAFRSQSTGTQASPAEALNAMGVDILLLAEIIEDMSHLFSDQGTTLCSDLLCQAAEELFGDCSNMVI